MTLPYPIEFGDPDLALLVRRLMIVRMTLDHPGISQEVEEQLHAEIRELVIQTDMWSLAHGGDERSISPNERHVIEHEPLEHDENLCLLCQA